MAKHLQEHILLEIKQVFSKEDLVTIEKFADHVKTVMPENFEDRKFGGDPENGGNYVTYMNQVFQEVLPHIYFRILHTANDELISAKWNPLIENNLGVRCIERLEYSEGNHLNWHEDTESVYTLILFLSQVGVDFEGGELKIKEDDSKILSHVGDLGSIFIFRSECSHAVAPILKGKRTVLVMEFWEFQNARRNDFRPDPQYGVPFD